MTPIARNEVLPIGEYETIRPRFRERVIAAKSVRRVSIGPHISAVFENRDSVLLQIQEMLRTERITSESGILHEIETYNELIPGEAELSVTLFVEIPERELRDQMLQELKGLEDTIVLTVGGERFLARGRRDEAMPDRTTAVHYLKFDLSPGARATIAEGNGPSAVRIEHPRYQHEAVLPPETLRSLADDLR